MIQYFFRGTQISADLFLLSAAYWLAFLFRFELNFTLDIAKLLFFTWPYVVVFEYLMLALFGAHRLAWRYIGLGDTRRLLGALGCATAALVALRLAMPFVGGYGKFVTIPLGVLAMNFVMSFLFVTGARVLRRIWVERSERARKMPAEEVEARRTLLIGAGQAGVLVVKEVRQNPNLGMKIVGFVDDDTEKTGITIQGVRVLGDTASLAYLVKKHDAAQAVITIAAAKGSDIRRIVGICEAVPIPVKIIPGISEILDGRVNLTRIREVTIEDLLGREAVKLDEDAIRRYS